MACVEITRQDVICSITKQSSETWAIPSGTAPTAWSIMRAVLGIQTGSLEVRSSLSKRYVHVAYVLCNGLECRFVVGITDHT